MGDEPQTRSRDGSGPSTGRLDSWKEIAAFLGRGIRTVQRWEREEGLPVHRLAHDKRGSIYARREELTAWWESRRVTLSAPPPAAEAGPAAPRLERVTRTASMTSWPALSSDARLIAYVSDSGHDGSTPQIYVQQIGGTALRLTDGEHAYSHLSFSADDTRIIYTVTDASGPDVYEVPTLGGDPRLLQRGASRGAMSADGRWLCSVGRDAAGIRIAARGGIGFRTVAPDLVDVACLAWSPDSRSVLVHARSEPAQEAEWWIVPIEGSSPTNTGVVRQFRESGMFTVPSGVAWMEDSFVISAAGPQGICLYRQRILPSTFQPAGPPQRLTDGSDSAWLPAAAAGRLAFVNSRTDANLWSIALDAASGTTRGPLRRLTRGPGILGNLSLTSELDTLAYFSVRLGQGDIFLRDLRRDSERVVNEGPPGGKWDPAISPSGRRLACANRTATAERALRPIFVIDLLDGTWRQLGDDCGGRPREWVDERRLIIQRFARPNSIAMIDIETGDQVELLKSPERSVANERLSPDRRWVAFESARHGELPAVLVSPLREEPIPEAEWIEVERSASHPFWSADGTLLYYATVGTNPLIRSLIRAKRFDPDGGITPGEPMAAFSASDASMPAYLPGMTPIATRDQILLVLGDFTSDVWLMDLRSRSAS